MDLVQLFKEFHDPPIHVYPIHKKLVGRATSALLFSYICRQIIYHRKDKIYNTDAELIDRVGLTFDELRGAKRHLRRLGFITISREGGKGRCHYTINEDLVQQTLVGMVSVSGNSCIGKFPKQTVSVSGNSLYTLKAHTKDKYRQSLSHPSGRGTVRLVLHPRWPKYATRLATAIATVRKIKTPPARLHSWAKSFALLHTQDKVEVPRIKAALVWYCFRLPTHHRSKYFLVIESGATFREKFSKLEAAMLREKDEAAEAEGITEEDRQFTATSIKEEGDGAEVEFD